MSRYATAEPDSAWVIHEYTYDEVNPEKRGRRARKKGWQIALRYVPGVESIEYTRRLLAIQWARDWAREHPQEFQAAQRIAQREEQKRHQRAGAVAQTV